MELVVAVAGAELVHRGVHPRVEAEQLGVAVAQCPDDDGAAVGGVTLADDPAAALEPVRMPVMVAVQPACRARALGLRAVTVDELQAVQVGVVEVDVGADVVVEQRQLDAELAQGLLDGAGQLPSTPGFARPACWHLLHMI